MKTTWNIVKRQESKLNLTDIVPSYTKWKVTDPQTTANVSNIFKTISESLNLHH
jgi:hypothetical protein